MTTCFFFGIRPPGELDNKRSSARLTRFPTFTHFPTFTYFSSESGTRIPSNNLVLINMYQDYLTRLQVSQESPKNRRKDDIFPSISPCVCDNTVWRGAGSIHWEEARSCCCLGIPVTPLGGGPSAGHPGEDSVERGGSRRIHWREGRVVWSLVFPSISS